MRAKKMAKFFQRLTSSSMKWKGPIQSPDEDLEDTSAKVPILLYDKTKEGDESNCFDPDTTCEEVCHNLGVKLDITPAMLHCYALAAFRKSDSSFLWLGPSDKLKGHAHKAKLHFRIRFLPAKDKCEELKTFDQACFKYLFWQVKWDFIHDMLETYTKKEKREASRGVVVLCILIMLRLQTETSGSRTENLRDFLRHNSMKLFLPNSLEGNILDDTYQNKGIVGQVEENQRKFPVSKCDSTYLMKAYLKYLLLEDQNEEKQYYYMEYYRAGTDEQQSTKPDLLVTIQMGCQLPSVTVTNKTTGAKTFSCQVTDLTEIEMVPVEEGMCKVNIRVSAQNQALYFATRSEAVSCVTCLDSYYRLIYDFSFCLCTELEPNDLKLKKKLRAHGPITDDFVLQKFRKREKLHDSGSKHNVYILRASSKCYHEYEVLYKDERSGKLNTCSLGKILKTGEHYPLDGSGAVRDLKVLIHKAILEEANGLGTWIRLNMQSEGCDILQNILTEENQVTLREEEEDEASARVYTASSLQLKNLIGQGHFTETYEALLHGKELVVAKRLRYSDIPDGSFRHVQESFQSGCDVLMELRDPRFFVEFMGVVLTKTPTVLMKLYKYGNLRAFLQSREPREHQLTMRHLCDVVVKLATALDYLDENHLCHGNLHCDNIMVSKFDRNELNVDIGDPGLATLYSKLGLESQINRRRLPWIAPELYGNLFDTSLKSDMFALGSTLWQIFSEGKNPLDVEPALKRKSVEEVCGFFSDKDRCLSRPLYLKERKDDSECIKTLKNQLYSEIMKLCWTVDPEERINPKTLLKTYLNLLQSYSTDYHDYNVIPEFSSEIYPVQSGASFTSGSHSYSGVASIIQTCDMPLDDLRSLERRSNQSQTIYQRRGLPSQQAHDSTIHNGSLVPGNVAAGNAIQDSPTVAGHAMQERPSVPGSTVSPMNFEGLSTAESPWVLRQGAGPTVLGGRTTQQTRQPLPSTPVSNVRYLIAEDRLSIDTDKCVGSGHYGAIYKGTLAPTSSLGLIEPTRVAVKVLKPNVVNDYGEEFVEEAKVMEQLDHKNIVKFYGVCKQGRYLVMEFVDNQCLYTFVKKEGDRCSPGTLLKFCVDIAAGMEYLSSKKVLHRDLAARNVLITQSLDAKISDFGMSKILQKDEDYYRRARNVDKNIPVLWSAPEWIGMKKFTTKSDVWSFAVVLWEVYSKGSLPNICKDLEEFKNKGVGWLRDGRRLPKPEKCSNDVYALMMLCWEYDQDKRPTFKECHTRLRAIAGLPDVEDIPENPHDYSRTNPQNDLIANAESGNNVVAVATGTDGQQRLVANGNSTVPLVTSNRQVPPRQSGVHDNGEICSVPNLQRNPGLEKGFQLSSTQKTNQRDQLLDPSKLEMDTKIKLGHGAFGEVYKATYDGREVAVKRCTKNAEYPRFRREIMLLYMIKHGNIVEFIGANYYNGEDGKKLEYAMEYMRFGNLRSYLENKAKEGRPVGVTTKVEFLIDIAEGMNYLFKKNIIQCDLTADNVLLSGTEGNLKAKICDFGWAKDLSTEDSSITYQRIHPKFKLQWTDYEVLQSHTYSLYSDIWSYGSLAVEVFGNGRFPDLDPTLYPDQQQKRQELAIVLLKRLKAGDRFKQPDSCPNDIYNKIIMRCWEAIPRNRIRFEEIIQKLQSFRTNINNET